MITPIKHILSLLIAMMCIACSADCDCLLNCTGCNECCCDCCNGNKKILVVKAVMPDNQSAESFHLSYGNKSLDFVGNTINVIPDSKRIDILLYNNDSETALVTRYGVATTNIEQGTDSIYYMPVGFYSKKIANVDISDIDTLDVKIDSRVHKYNVNVELHNNDGRIVSCLDMLAHGFASHCNLHTLEISGTGSHRLDTNYTDDSISSIISTWGLADTKQTITFCFRCSNGKLFSMKKDITSQTTTQPVGGNINIQIDVMKEIKLEEDANGGLDVDVSDWHPSDSTTIIL